MSTNNDKVCLKIIIFVTTGSHLIGFKPHQLLENIYRYACYIYNSCHNPNTNQRRAPQVILKVMTCCVSKHSIFYRLDYTFYFQLINMKLDIGHSHQIREQDLRLYHQRRCHFILQHFSTRYQIVSLEKVPLYPVALLL